MKHLFICIFSILSISVFSQQKITLKEAEQKLQKNNLLLVAEYYNIGIAKAATIQAKIWDQPYISLEMNAYNPQNNSTFDIGNKGQKALAIQQLFYIGGKRKNEIKYAKTKETLAEIQFEQLLRDLNYQLRLTFYTQYFDQKKLLSLEKQIVILDELLSNNIVQAKKGNIPLKDVARLQSLVLSLKNNKIELLNTIAQSQQTLLVLTGINEPIEPIVDETTKFSQLNTITLSKEEIVNLALENNLDYKRAIKETESQEIYLKLQKSLTAPSMNAGVAYDQRGGAFNNQTNLTLGFPLPLWNKNKGNIKIAQTQISQSKANQEYLKLFVKSKAESNYNIWQQQLSQWKGIDPSAATNINEVYDGMIANFKKRNITLLEFTDFMESYNQTSFQLNEMKKSIIQSEININYITSKEIF